MTVAPATDGRKPVELPGVAQVKNRFEVMKTAARQKLESAGLDPDNLPDYKADNQAFKEAELHGQCTAPSFF